MKRQFNFIILLALLQGGCSETKPAETEQKGVKDENVVILSQKQFEAAGIMTTVVRKQKVSNHIQVNGMIDVPPQSLVVISPPIGGFVRNTTLKEGMKVRKGDHLVSLENIDFIQLQQDYLENRSRLEFLEAEFARQEELARENINSGKTMQQARSNYESMKATVRALEAKLKLVNISPASLVNGEIQSRINVYSPIDGFVSSVSVNPGQFVNSTDPMFRIVNLDHVHVLLHVYEKDIPFLREGQEVRFHLGNETTERIAEIYLIGKEITAERTVSVHCHLKQEKQNFLPGMFVSASIQVGEKEADVVASDAVLTYQDQYIVFAATGADKEFRMLRVKPGVTNDNFTQIEFIDALPENGAIVVKGASELLGVLKNSGEEE